MRIGTFVEKRSLHWIVVPLSQLVFGWEKMARGIASVVMLGAIGLWRKYQPFTGCWHEYWERMLSDGTLLDSHDPQRTNVEVMPMVNTMGCLRRAAP